MYGKLAKLQFVYETYMGVFDLEQNKSGKYALYLTAIMTLFSTFALKTKINQGLHQRVSVSVSKKSLIQW